MASLMQRDVLLEYACVGHLFPMDRNNEMKNDSKKMGEIYHQILMSEHEEIDFEKMAQKIEEIRKKYYYTLFDNKILLKNQGLFFEFFVEKLKEIYSENYEIFIEKLEKEFIKFDFVIKNLQDEYGEYYKFGEHDGICYVNFISKYDMSRAEVENIIKNVTNQFPEFGKIVKSVKGRANENFVNLNIFKDSKFCQNLLNEIEKANENAEFFAQRVSENVWQEVILDKNPFAKSGNEHPKAYVLGGQPGAGKANMLRLAMSEVGENGIVINGDEFRKYHPYFMQICAIDSDKMAERTALFSAKLTEIIINKAIEKRYNIAIEGTFRTADTPIFTLKKFKNAGYKTQVLIQTCDSALSWKSCNERYEIWKKLCPLEARYVVQSHHDLVVSKLYENIKIVSESEYADNIGVFTRK